MACVCLTLPSVGWHCFLYCFLVAPRPVCLGTLPDSHCWHAEIWNRIPVSNWSFTQSFCYWLSVISDAEISVISLSVILADHAWQHGAVVGMATCCSAGVGARQLDAAGCSKARYALDNKYRQLYLSLW